MNLQQNSFQIKTISFPKIDCMFVDVPSEREFECAYRVNAVVTGESNLKIIFGVKLTSKEKFDEKTPKVRVIVESLAEFEFPQPLPKVEDVSQIPLAGNLLALIYPFIREKINYCLSNNNIQVFLPPINTIQLIQNTERGPAFNVVDARTQNPVPSTN